MHSELTAEVQKWQSDVIVECYLDAKYYHYDPVDVLGFVEFNETVENLLEEDNIVTVQNAEMDEFNLALSLNDNFQELEKAWNGSKILRPYVQSGLNTINLDI